MAWRGAAGIFSLCFLFAFQFLFQPYAHQKLSHLHLNGLFSRLIFPPIVRKLTLSHWLASLNSHWSISNHIVQKQPKPFDVLIHSYFLSPIVVKGGRRTKAQRPLGALRCKACDTPKPGGPVDHCQPAELVCLIS